VCRASIIVVSWNGVPYLKDCLDSVLAQIGPEDEVILVDNASTDGSVELVRAWYPEVRIIENPRNLGFAGGANVGLRAARGDFLILLNQDVRVLPGWLDALIDTFSVPNVGIAGCKLLYPDGRIQHAGGLIYWPLGLPDHLGYGQPDQGQWDELREVDYVTGASWGFRRDVMEQVGLLDEGFWPGYYEEVDYCFRARKAGWLVVYNPKSAGIHKESVSLGKGSQIYNEALHRGRLRFVLKHTPLSRLMDEFFPAEARFLREASIELRRALARAYLNTMLIIPEVLCTREHLNLAPDIIAEFSRLRSAALHVSGGLHMMEIPELIQQLPPLREFDFPSRVPLIGPVISFIRRLLYGLTAKWGVWYIIQQQNKINRILWERLHHLEALLLDLDRDLTAVVRIVVEIEIRQRQLETAVRERFPAPDQDEIE